jgi:hypothetical protein
VLESLGGKGTSGIPVSKSAPISSLGKGSRERFLEAHDPFSDVDACSNRRIMGPDQIGIAQIGKSPPLCLIGAFSYNYVVVIITILYGVTP